MQTRKNLYTLTAALLLSTIFYAQAVKKQGIIDLTMTANDSMHIATARITDVVSKTPLKGIEATFFVKRTFGLMKLGTGTTDTTGIVSAEFPVNIPGSDASRNMTIIAKVEDNDIINDTASQAIIQSPVPFPADKPLPREMISPRAPWWLVITFSLVVGIVWLLFANVLYLIFRIKKASHLSIISQTIK